MRRTTGIVLFPSRELVGDVYNEFSWAIRAGDERIPFQPYGFHLPGDSRKVASGFRAVNREMVG